ncbi:MAG: hypothetical protein U0946_07690 [Patescibacteria group bacterium]|nr:hypothetical protein [Patescibacteria group bacterium]
MLVEKQSFLRPEPLRINGFFGESLSCTEAIGEIRRLGRGTWLPLQIEKYRELFERMQNLNSVPNHDLPHNLRVLLYTRPILKLMETAIGEMFDSAAVEAVAIEHDRRRSGIKFDWWHGWLASRDLKTDFYWLSPKSLELAAQICKWHSVEDSLTPPWIKNKIEWAVFCDADNLDRTRIGDFNPKYLRLFPSSIMVSVAKELCSLSAKNLQRGAGGFDAVIEAGQEIGLIEKTNESRL